MDFSTHGLCHFSPPWERHTYTMALRNWQVIHETYQHQCFWINTVDLNDIFIVICSCSQHPLSPSQTVAAVRLTLCDIAHLGANPRLTRTVCTLSVGSLSSGGSDTKVSAAAFWSGWRLGMWGEGTASDQQHGECLYYISPLRQGAPFW